MPITEAFKRGRGRMIDQFTRHAGEAVKTMRFAVEILERAEVPEPKEEELKSRQPRRRQRYVIVTEGPEDAAYLANHLADLLAVPCIEPSLVRRNLQGWQWLRLESSHLGNPSERADAGQLLPDGSNLPTVLAGLAAPVLGAIQADLVSLVPGITSFEIVPEGDTLRIDFDMSGGERLPARLVSDGTLRILALLTALRAEPRPYLLGIEEAENGVYPGHLRGLVELLREAAARYPDPPVLPEKIKADGASGHVITNLLPTQVIVTTHSPVALAALRAHPQHLRFVDTVRRNGERVTRARPVGKASGPAAGRSVVSPREIDMLLHSVRVEDAE